MGRLDRTSGRPFSFCFDHFPLLLLSMIGDTDLWWDPLRVLLFAAYMAFLALAEGVVWFVPPGFTRPRFLGTGRRPLALPFENDGGSREEDLVPCQLHQIWPG